MIEVNAVRSRSTVHSSPENSRLPVMDPADPGMQHINRFLGRNPSDPGLQHINRFLGQEYFVSTDNNGNDNNSESDVGMQHVRRALGMVDSVTRTDTTRRTSVPSPIPRRISLDTYRPSSQSLQTLHNSSVPHDLNGNAQYIQRSRTDSAVARGRDHTPYTSSGEDLSEQLPSYQEAITLLARQESELEIEPPPPRYEDVINEDLESVRHRCNHSYSDS